MTHFTIIIKWISIQLMRVWEQNFVESDNSKQYITLLRADWGCKNVEFTFSQMWIYSHREWRLYLISISYWDTRIMGLAIKIIHNHISQLLITSFGMDVVKWINNPNAWLVSKQFLPYSICSVYNLQLPIFLLERYTINKAF